MGETILSQPSRKQDDDLARHSIASRTAVRSHRRSVLWFTPGSHCMRRASPKGEVIHCREAASRPRALTRAADLSLDREVSGDVQLQKFH